MSASIRDKQQARAQQGARAVPLRTWLAKRPRLLWRLQETNSSDGEEEAVAAGMQAAAAGAGGAAPAPGCPEGCPPCVGRRGRLVARRQACHLCSWQPRQHPTARVCTH